MRALVVGGASSGKSAFAERLAAALSDERTYLATMRAQGAEALERIERHRAQRARLGFETLELADTLELGEPAGAARGVVLVEDLGNLAANALFAPDGTMTDASEVRSRLVREYERLGRHFAHVVAVGVEVGRAGYTGSAATDAWIELVGALAAEVAARSDVVCEVVAGIAQVLKGRLPWNS